MSLKAYTALSRVLLYPGSDYGDRLKSCRQILEAEYPSTLEVFDRYMSYVRETKSSELEELFTRTFDIHAVCCLDVGFVLFGEDYKRGQMLVSLLDYCREYELDCGTELADHLTNVLPMIGRIKETRPQEAEDFVARLVYPALQQMLDKFSEGEKSLGNPCVYLLETIASVLKQDFKTAERFVVRPLGGQLPVLHQPAEFEDLETGGKYE